MLYLSTEASRVWGGGCVCISVPLLQSEALLFGEPKQCWQCPQAVTSPQRGSCTAWKKKPSCCWTYTQKNNNLSHPGIYFTKLSHFCPLCAFTALPELQGAPTAASAPAQVEFEVLLLSPCRNWWHWKCSCRDLVIVFRKQKNVVPVSVVTNFVSKDTNHPWHGDGCQGCLGIKERNNWKYIFYKHFLPLVFILVLPVGSCMGGKSAVEFGSSLHVKDWI